MSTFVAITSQGQISIPTSIRRTLGLDKFRKALVDIRDSLIVIEPVGDLLSLEGALAHKAQKGKSTASVLKQEKQAVAQAVAEKYQTKNKQSS